VIGVLLVCALLVVVAYTWGVRGMWSALQRKMIYFPTSVLAYTPTNVGLRYEDVHFQTSDGVKLHGWMVPCPGAEVTLLFCHGNAGNISDRVENVLRLHGIGLQVFIFDYRGYGRSEGRPNEQGLYKDAQAAYAHLVSRDDLDPEHIAIFGRSLGGAVAVDLASRVSCWRLILESTFSSAPDVAKHMIPFLPMGRLISERFESESKIDKVQAPLLQFHGTRDEIIPYKLGERLFQAAPEPKEFFPIQGATHNDTYLVGGRPYFEKIKQFLSR
jgi:fermentation-respiration switch protein FrsA (DUF1100 family)